MKSKILIPPGFKDEVNFNAYVEHQYKNKIIDYFRLNGFDLVKTSLIEYSSKEDNNNFLIESKKGEDKLKIRNDITPQIVRLAYSRLSKRKRPLKLCYYGEVTRKYGSMLRPERQFLQVGAETIGENKVDADIEIINIAYISLSLVGIKNITIELSSKIFLEELFNKIKDKKIVEKLQQLIKKKDLENCLKLVGKENKQFIKNIFLCTGSFKKINSKLELLNINKNTSNEIKNIRQISKSLNLNKNDNLYIDFTEFNEKKYHTGIRFTFFAKNVRGEIASGGRYLIINDKFDETATGFTCYMDTIIRASSFESESKKILIPFKTNKKIKKNLLNKGFIIFSIFDDCINIEKKAKKYGCKYYLSNQKVKLA